MTRSFLRRARRAGSAASHSVSAAGRRRSRGKQANGGRAAASLCWRQAGRAGEASRMRRSRSLCCTTVSGPQQVPAQEGISW
ncbi:hypothetical protein TSOC_004100 [Tetrabaena socialis]|uniref:Uncharacterized protein n=1 Tax=Tetrabaena socialis TaxID=47790 RepID=A0A2J8A9X2_9CHLO|nr:hypothetical protein TSOC_004100 [Tetrabaena socialis]|eukprot:PNH09309.1 hypothetical protein TSOC_004100 [Tetrabaena socialis]